MSETALAIPTPTPKSVPLPVSVRLREGEHVLLALRPSVWWTLGLYLFTLGLWFFWRKRHVYVLTNERVLAVKGIISTREASTPLTRIQDVHMGRSPFTGGSVAWSSAGGALGVGKIRQITRDNALRFADALTPLIGHQSGGA